MDINDNTDDAEPMMIRNANIMVTYNEERVKLADTLKNTEEIRVADQAKLNFHGFDPNNDPDLNMRKKMNISFDPFDARQATSGGTGSI